MSDPLCARCVHPKSWHGTDPRSSRLCSGHYGKKGNLPCKCHKFAMGLGQELDPAPDAPVDELARYDKKRATPKQAKLIERWLRFHPANPDHWAFFVKFSLQAVEAERTRFGGFAVINRIRWYTAVESKDDAFKISNDWSPFYTRLFRHVYPQHADLFKFETAAADLVYYDKVPTGA